MAAENSAPHSTRPPGRRPQDNAGDAADFLADITVPHYSPLAAGTRFVKTWRLRNTGRTTWDDGYSLKFVGGDPMGGPPQVPLADPVRPGGDLVISVQLAAPQAEGVHAGRWQMQSAHGELFGALLHVIVAVTPGPAPAVPEAPVPKAAAQATAAAPRPAPAAPETAAAPAGPLQNPAFDQGAYDRGGLPEVPRHWDVWCADENTPLLPRQDQRFDKPQAAILSLGEATDLGRGAFLAGEHCWKVWAAWRPVWVVLRQRLTGLTPNARYRFTVPIHPDLVMHEGGEGRHYADDPLAGEHRLAASFGGQTLATVWQDGRDVPFGATTFLTLEFSPTTAQATVAVELRARWGLERIGWFVNGARLELLPEGDEPAPPPAGPALRRPPRPPRAPRLLRTPRPLAPKAAPKPLPVPPPVELTPIPIRNRLFDLSLDGWQTWANVAPGDCAYQMPRFETYASPVVPYRVLAGRTALRVSAEAGQSYEAGVRQTVTGIAPGTPLRFQAHGQAWASTGEDPFKSEGMGAANLRVGIDPRGGKDPNAPDVVWSFSVDPWDEYKQIEVEAVALSEAVTLFLYSHPAPCLKHNETFWDSTALFSTGPAVAVPLDAPQAAAAPPQPAAPEAAAPPPESASEPAGDGQSRPNGGSPGGANLLRNASFDDGYYYRAPELAVPEEWELWYAGGDTPKLERQDVPFTKPDSSVWNRRDAKKKKGEERYFRNGDYCWRVRTEWKPAWVRLQQRVTGLTPGAAYRFTVPVLVEPWAVGEGPDQRLTSDPVAAERRLWAESGDATADTGWLGGEAVPYGEYERLSLDFTAETEEATVALELRGRWGLSRSQWVVDEMELRRLE